MHSELLSELSTMNSFSFLFYATVLFELGYSMSLGVSCQDHPGYVEGVIPVMVKSWEILYGIKTLPGVYLVGHEQHRFAPVDEPDSMKYDRLDWFFTQKSGSAKERAVRLTLNRRAKVYMLVPMIPTRSGPNPTMTGWTSEGRVKLTKGSGVRMQYGIFQTETRPVMEAAYAFSKVTNGDVLLPNMKWVQTNARGLFVVGDWIVMIAEEDGSAPILQYPPNPAGVDETIKPNARCPDQLHDLWVTGSTDENDEDTRGMTWKTWHPQWDPCHWCGYDHEHGSSPKHLMGYEPKFHYTAWKNGREGESHEGYKGHVFQYGTYFVYMMVHLQTSNMRRVVTRHHTVLLAVTDAATKELLMEISHKADFGFIGVKTKTSRLIPLFGGEWEEHDRQKAEGALRRSRSINVLDFGKLNRYYLYHSPKREIRRGVYETWTTTPLCAADSRLGLLTFDVTNSATGIQHPSTRAPKQVTLGYSKLNTFYRNIGNSRLLRLAEFSFGEEYCGFKLGNIKGERFEDGSFYTDAYGTHLRKGASEDSIRQFVKKGFNMRISGKFAAVESWTGLYGTNLFGSMVNYGYSVNPDIN